MQYFELSRTQLKVLLEPTEELMMMLRASKQYLAQTLPQFYGPRIKRLCIALGIHETLVWLHGVLLSIPPRVGYLFADDCISMRVGMYRADFHVDSWIEYDRVTTQIGEKPILNQFLNSLQEDDVVWDIGANIGIYAILTAVSDRDFRVVAFEPHPENAARIRENANLNDIDNIDVEEMALGNQEGTIDLHTKGDEFGTGEHSLVLEGEASISVDICTGDGYVADGGLSPNVLKVDVEGAELDVLRGIDGILRNEQCRAVYIEVHHDRGVSNEDVVEFFDERGFQVEKLAQRGGTTFLSALSTPSSSESGE